MSSALQAIIWIRWTEYSTIKSATLMIGTWNLNGRVSVQVPNLCTSLYSLCPDNLRVTDSLVVPSEWAGWVRNHLGSGDGYWSVLGRIWLYLDSRKSSHWLLNKFSRRTPRKGVSLNVSLHKHNWLCRRRLWEKKVMDNIERNPERKSRYVLLRSEQVWQDKIYFQVANLLYSLSGQHFLSLWKRNWHLLSVMLKGQRERFQHPLLRRPKLIKRFTRQGSEECQETRAQLEFV